MPINFLRTWKGVLGDLHTAVESGEWTAINNGYIDVASNELTATFLTIYTDGDVLSGESDTTCKSLAETLRSDIILGVGCNLASTNNHAAVFQESAIQI